MLSSMGILDNIKSKCIVIRPSFLPNRDGTFRYVGDSLDSDENNREAFDFLIKGLIRNRVRLTSGPLIMPLPGHPVPKRYCFSNHKHIVDLQKLASGYKLGPGKSAIIFTNEWVSLDKGHAAVIVSGVSNYKRGLVITTTLVDSQWQGILKLLVTNLSDKFQIINTGEDIARMFFFECGEDSREDSILADTASHYRYSWLKIFRHGMDPFDQAPALKSSFDLRQRLKQANELAGKWIGLSLILLLLYAIGSAFDIYKKYQDIGRLSDSVIKHEQNLNSVMNSLAYSGIQSITLKPGESITETQIPLRELSKLEPGYLLYEQIQPDTNVNINGEIVKGSDQYFIHLSLQNDKPVEKVTTVKVRWAIIP